MSDSDEDILSNNVFTFQNDNTMISARGPNVNNTNITGLSFRNNVLTSTMNIPGSFAQQRYGGSNIDQRSMYCRRETSPMSLRSVPNYGAPSFTRSVYQNGMGSKRSVYSGRGASPMSVRSIDTTTSVSAADIVFAFKNVKFNKYDMQVIKEAYNKLIKTRHRKKIEKRRNLKMFLKGRRRMSGGDSGEQGSDSSISNDDCRSVRTTICKENTSVLKRTRDFPQFSTNIQRPINNMTSLSHFSNDIREHAMFTDHTENIKQNTLRNMVSVCSSIPNLSTKDRFNKRSTQEHNQCPLKEQNTSVMTQKERFTKGFLLPSKRFNSVTSGQTQINNNNKKIKNLEKNIESTKLSEENSGSDDQEEIIHGVSINQLKNNQNNNRKRSLELEIEDSGNSNKKTRESDSPYETQSSTKNSTCKNVAHNKSSDFIFAKPKMPIKKTKGNPIKDLLPEKVLAKSHVPLATRELDFHFDRNNKVSSNKENNNEINHTQTDMTHSNSDTSMRPSFIKRKLYTQKLDVGEQKNVSSDSVGVNSPQNIYSASMRERNKARKLTSQSCLSREITGDDSNVLDLIHKIVPPDKINNTNKSDSINGRLKDVENRDKWDVTTIIANCDNEDVSDTYTDDEIFNINYKKVSEQTKKSEIDSKKELQCRVVVQKLPPQTQNKIMKSIKNSSGEAQTKSTGTIKKRVTDCVKSFWDTDFESDMELNVAPVFKNNVQQNQVLQKRNKDLGDKQNENSKKVPISKGTILTVRQSHKLKVNNSLKSHITPLNNDKKCIEPNKHNGILEKVDTKVNKNREPSLTSRTGRNKESANNINCNSEVRRQSKVKHCVDCVEDIPVNKSRIANKTKKLTKRDTTVNNRNNVKNISPKNGKGKEKVVQSGQNKNILKEPINNVRIQPKRKSKDRSLMQSSKLTSNTKAQKKIVRTNELFSQNDSMNSTSPIMTRSREKLSFVSSQGDSSTNTSGISNRSLRLRKKVDRFIYTDNF